MSWHWHQSAAQPSQFSPSPRRWPARGQDGWQRLENEKWWNLNKGKGKTQNKWQNKWQHYDLEKENESEWSCAMCLTGNWLSRATCRGCSTQWSSKVTAAKPNKNEDKAKLEALQAALESLPESVHTTEIKQKCWTR